MANIKKSAEELIGRTPLMELVNYEKAAGVTDAVILAKLEYFNPRKRQDCPADDSGC